MLPDNEVLSQVLEALYEAPLDLSRWDEFLKLTAKAVGGQDAALMLSGPSCLSVIRSKESGRPSTRCGLCSDSQRPNTAWPCFLWMATDPPQSRKWLGSAVTP